MSRAPRLAFVSELALLTACATLPQAAFQGDADRVARELSSGKVGVDDRYPDTECYQCTLLHYAAAGGWVAVVRLLLEHGADANSKDNGGRTALHHACFQQNLAAARFLLANGAKPSLAVRDGFGNTPLLVAVAAQKEREAWVFTMFGAVPTTVKARGPKVELVELLLAEGADVSTPTNEGNTPLHIAAYWGHAELVSVLLAHGAEREARNDTGATPAVLAAAHGKAEVVTLLQQPR